MWKKRKIFLLLKGQSPGDADYDDDDDDNDAAGDFYFDAWKVC